jgi:hypothetical protein
MRTLRKNSPGQVEWNGGSTTFVFCIPFSYYFIVYLVLPSYQRKGAVRFGLRMF